MKNLLDIYNELSDLFEKDPVKAEEKAREFIDAFIKSIPDEERRDRLQKIQWNIDQQLSRYKDPIARMNKMVELFWKQVNDFASVLNNPEKHLQQEKTAKIIQFIPKEKQSTDH